MSNLKLHQILSTSVWALLAVGAVNGIQMRGAIAQTSASQTSSESIASSTDPVSFENLPQLPNRLEMLQFSGQSSGQSSQRTAANPVAAANQTSLTQLTNAYRIGPGDVIQVNVFNVPEYSGSQQVLADGSVNLNAISPVNVNGLTPQQAEQAISSAYRSELRYPQITVVLETPRPLRVAIAGEVGQPGLYTLSPDGNAQFPTVSQALQMAGGVTQAADLNQVQLKRADGRGGYQMVMLDLWSLLNSGDTQQNIPLRDGDAIVIGETTTVNLTETNQLSASNLSLNTEQDIVIAVVGEVFRPGAYEFAGGSTKGKTTLTQAVQTAGGIKPSADIQQIQVRRRTRSGAEQLIDIDFWQLLQGGDLTQNLVLQQGDTVVIPEATESTPTELSQLAAANLSPEGVKVNVVGEVASPGQLQISPNTTLNQAVLAAGGFTERSTEIVELIRLNPNGSVTQREIEVDLTEGVDSEKNPLLLNNDVVLVGRNARTRFGDTLGGILRPVMQLLTPLGILF